MGAQPTGREVLAAALAMRANPDDPTGTTIRLDDALDAAAEVLAEYEGHLARVREAERIIHCGRFEPVGPDTWYAASHRAALSIRQALRMPGTADC